jgi:outer membrane protein OmpA-like peptidoglycan-associated protein
MKKIQMCFVVVLMVFLSWQTALAKEKLTAQDWFKKGVAFEEQLAYGEAVKMYTNAIKMDDQFSEAYFRRGRSMFRTNTTDTMEAMEDFDRVIDLDPRNADAYYERGLLHAYMIDNEMARNDMEAAAALGHEKAQQWLNPDLKKKEKSRYVHLANYLPSKRDPIVFFDFNRSTLKPPFYSLLDEVGIVLKNTLPAITIIIAGYCDSIGPEKYNVGLSERRAKAVSNYLSQKYGITPDRIVIKAYGEGGPIAPNETEEGRAQNRRAEMLGLRSS